MGLLAISVQHFLFIRYDVLHGEMAEWSIAHPWKGCIRATVSGVRIPLSPPAKPGHTDIVYLHIKNV